MRRCVFISVHFLQFRLFRSCICLVEITYLGLWMSVWCNSSWVFFVFHRSTTLLQGICIDYGRMMMLCSCNCIKLPPLTLIQIGKPFNLGLRFWCVWLLFDWFCVDPFLLAYFMYFSLVVGCLTKIFHTGRSWGVEYSFLCIFCKLGCLVHASVW